jgi:hypothetical protein
MNRTLLLAGLLFGSVSACAGARDVPDELPVTRVVLYQSGVAYLEREGRVVGDHVVMPIRADQINDILATLVVASRGEVGGTSVSLPIDDAAADRMADLPPELRDAGGLVAVLHAFRGADVVARGDGQLVRGRVVGVELIDGEPHVTLLTRGDAMIPLAIAALREVDLQRGSLSTGLRRSLDHSLAEGDWKPTDVTIRFGRDGAHDLTMAYVVEQPIWKPAYRVVLDDDAMLLQGWAVIDNVSGTDWTDVRLSLTAGSPISFRYDLHTPMFVDRPDMSGYGQPSVANLRPPDPVAATRSRRASGPAPAAAPMMERAQAFDQRAGEMAYADAEEVDESVGWSADSFQASGGTSASITEVGAMFRFDVPGRVTLPDQTSTMVTLVNTAIEGEDALLFQPGNGPASDQHPYRALLLENSTPYPIQRAPIAIYTAGTFVGQGITPLVAPASSAVVPYAVESRVRIAQRASSRSGEVSLLRVVDGVIYTESQTIQAVDFEMQNGLGEAQRVHLRVPRYTGYTLEASESFSPEDVQTEASYYLIPVSMADGNATISVAQSTRVESRADAFSPQAKAVLLAYLDRPDARPEVAEALRPVVAMLNELEGLDRQMMEARQVRADLDRRANELRSNIAALGDAEANRSLRATLVERLAAQDEQQAEIAATLVELAERASLLRVSVTEGLRSVTLR